MSVFFSWICSSDEFKRCWCRKFCTHCEYRIWNLAIWQPCKRSLVVIPFNCCSLSKELLQQNVFVPCPYPILFVCNEFNRLEVQLPPEAVLPNELHRVPNPQGLQPPIVADYGIPKQTVLLCIPCQVRTLPMYSLHIWQTEIG